jgi:hypothetical protein
MQKRAHLLEIPPRVPGKKAHTSLMTVGQHRATRHPFAARAEVVDVESEKQVMAHTGDLSAFGCFIETASPFPRGTKVRIRINHHGATFVASGVVSYSRSNGMGVRFGAIEPAHQQTLENWLAQLRTGD